MKNKVDHFKNRSKSWDMNSKRVQNAKEIADLIINNIALNDSMELMDFGAGTGLLSYFVSPKVKKIVAVDNSPSMLREFENKSDQFSCETEIVKKDLSVEILDRKFDGIISSMTLHHLEDIKSLFSKFYTMLNSDGFIALADLDKEDGSFHSDNSGVFHYGLDQEILKNIAKEVGFRKIYTKRANHIEKKGKIFTVFLLTAVK